MQEETGSPENRSSWRDVVARLAAEVALREGCEIYDIEFIGAGGNRALRIFIDKVDGGGVSIDDCANVSRGLNLMLDVDDVIPGGAYNLEVSSPGLERHLRTPAHFVRAKGSRVQIKTFDSLVNLEATLSDEDKARLGKAKQVEGVLTDVVDDTLVIQAENGGHVVPVRVPVDKVTKASTVFVLEAQGPKHHGQKKKTKLTAWRLRFFLLAMVLGGQ